MKPLTFLIFFCCTFGTISLLPQGAPNGDAVLPPSPSADRPHHVQRRVLEEEDPFFGDPVIRFFLRVLMTPFSIFSPERKTRPHASRLSTGLKRNSTDQKTAKSESMEKMNETEKSDAIFGKIESKPNRRDEFGAAHRKHFRFDSFPFVFDRPVAERSGPVIDPEMTETADDMSTKKHSLTHGTLKTAGSSTQGKNITNINFFNRRYAFIWSIEWRSLVMHIIVVMLFALIITLVLLFCQTVFKMQVKKVQLHPDKFSLPKDEKFVNKQEAKNMC